jgi:hypothetical protein
MQGFSASCTPTNVLEPSLWRCRRLHAERSAYADAQNPHARIEPRDGHTSLFKRAAAGASSEACATEYFDRRVVFLFAVPPVMGLNADKKTRFIASHGE